MPNYYFECPECGAEEVYLRPIAEGPPKGVNCPLCEEVENELVEMTHQLGGNFILKGDGWPGKELKAGDYAMGQVKEQTDQQMSEDSRNQRVVDEVMAVRRQGTEATDRLKKNEPQKFKDYQAAVKDGYRAAGKSYQMKGK